MIDKTAAEQFLGAPISDHDFEVMSDAVQRLGTSVDQVTSSLRQALQPEPIDYSELSGPPAQKRKRIHDRRPWPVPKVKGF